MADPVKIAIFTGIGAVMVASALSSNPKTAPISAVPPGPLPGLRSNVAAPGPQLNRAEVSPFQLPGQSSGFGAVKIPRGRDGHYHVSAELNGRSIPMLVDTGATSIALSYEDASAAGILPMPADFKVPMQTANGTSYGAIVRLQEVRVGSITVHDVQGVVVPRGALSGSLLGMSFLAKLNGFEVAADNLVLKP